MRHRESGIVPYGAEHRIGWEGLGNADDCWWCATLGVSFSFNVNGKDFGAILSQVQSMPLPCSIFMKIANLVLLILPDWS